MTFIQLVILFYILIILMHIYDNHFYGYFFIYKFDILERRRRNFTLL